MKYWKIYVYFFFHFVSIGEYPKSSLDGHTDFNGRLISSNYKILNKYELRNWYTVSNLIIRLFMSFEIFLSMFVWIFM